jgi:hypothetical protein
VVIARTARQHPLDRSIRRATSFFLLFAAPFFFLCRAALFFFTTPFFFLCRAALFLFTALFFFLCRSALFLFTALFFFLCRSVLFFFTALFFFLRRAALFLFLAALFFCRAPFHDAVSPAFGFGIARTTWMNELRAALELRSRQNSSWNLRPLDDAVILAVGFCTSCSCLAERRDRASGGP